MSTLTSLKYYHWTNSEVGEISFQGIDNVTMKFPALDWGKKMLKDMSDIESCWHMNLLVK